MKLFTEHHSQSNN